MDNSPIAKIKRKMMQTYDRNKTRYWALSKDELLVFIDYLEATNQPISAAFLRKEAEKKINAKCV